MGGGPLRRRRGVPPGRPRPHDEGGRHRPRGGVPPGERGGDRAPGPPGRGRRGSPARVREHHQGPRRRARRPVHGRRPGGPRGCLREEQGGGREGARGGLRRVRPPRRGGAPAARLRTRGEGQLPAPPPGGRSPPTTAARRHHREPAELDLRGEPGRRAPRLCLGTTFREPDLSQSPTGRTSPPPGWPVGSPRRSVARPGSCPCPPYCSALGRDCSGAVRRRSG